LAVNIAHSLEKVVKADGTIVLKRSAAFTYDAARFDAIMGLK